MYASSPVATTAPMPAIAKQPTPMKVPGVGAITKAMGEMRSEYEAARETKFTQKPSTMPTFGVGTDWHVKNEQDFWYMLEYSRHLERNDPILEQGVDRFVANVTQGGFKLKPETGADWTDRFQEEMFQEFAEESNAPNVDYQMRHNWRTIERLAIKRTILDGDLGIAPMRNGRLQNFESHRIRSPYYGQLRNIRRIRNCFLGVETNSRNQIARYWTNPDNDGHRNVRNGRQNRSWGVKAWDWDEMTQQNEQNFFHLMIPSRFNQTRGINAFVPVLQTLGMHGDVHFATLVKQQMASFVGLVHDVPMMYKDDYEMEANFEWDYATNSYIRKGSELYPGAEFWPMYPGEKITPFQANIPNAEFFDHAKLLLTFISLRLGMPLILFLLDASETNFSAWRGALDQAKIQFRMFQSNIAGGLHSPIWRWKLRRFLRTNPTYLAHFKRMGADALRFKWQPPNWPYIEPEKDVKADAAEVAANLQSPSAVAARRGIDYMKMIAETVTDRGKLIELAIIEADRLNKHPYIVAHPDEAVTWREIAHPVLPDGLQMQILDKNAESSNERGEGQGQNGQGQNGNGKPARRRQPQRQFAHPPRRMAA